MAVSRDGVESPFSNEESIQVNIVPPGANMVSNGDFSNQQQLWTFQLTDVANATSLTQDGTAEISISNGGEALTSVALSQSAKTLLQGKNYVLEFDAWADQPRYIQVSLAKTISPFVDYSNISPLFLTPIRTHFHYLFTMQKPSDFSAVLAFNLGASTATVHLANVNLFTPATADLNMDGHVDLLDLSTFSNQWLKKQAGLVSDLTTNSQVDFLDFGIWAAAWPGGTP
jgi:hypothetical protein